MTEGAAFICEAIEAMAQGKFYEKFSIDREGRWERKDECETNETEIKKGD